MVVTLKEEICNAFCSDIVLSEFDGGYAIGTPYSNRAGDKIGIYALEKEPNIFRLVDNALTIAFLEADGMTLDNPSRRKALDGLLQEYGAEYDEETGEIFIDGIKWIELARYVLSFSALLLRINDLAWLSQEKVRNTFKDDARVRIRNALEDVASIREDEPVSEALREVTPDMVITAKGRDPVAVFIATDDLRVWQAMHLRLIADYEAKTPVLVVAMLERDGVITSRVRAQADNRLDAIPKFEVEPEAAVQRVARQVLGHPVVMH